MHYKEHMYIYIRSEGIPDANNNAQSDIEDEQSEIEYGQSDIEDEQSDIEYKQSERRDFA
jgi:hypothetical protein